MPEKGDVVPVLEQVLERPARRGLGARVLLNHGPARDGVPDGRRPVLDHKLGDNRVGVAPGVGVGADGVQPHAGQQAPRLARRDFRAPQLEAVHGPREAEGEAGAVGRPAHVAYLPLRHAVEVDAGAGDVVEALHVDAVVVVCAGECVRVCVDAEACEAQLLGGDLRDGRQVGAVEEEDVLLELGLEGDGGVDGGVDEARDRLWGAAVRLGALVDEARVVGVEGGLGGGLGGGRGGRRGAGRVGEYCAGSAGATRGRWAGTGERAEGEGGQKG